MGIRNLEEFELWQLSMGLFKIVLAIIEREPAKHDREYCDQILDAARSVSSNLAEGYGRYSPAEFSRFINMALGSLKEVKSLLFEARLRRFCTAFESEDGQALVRRIKSGSASLKFYLRTGRPPTRRSTAHEPKP